MSERETPRDYEEVESGEFEIEPEDLGDLESAMRDALEAVESVTPEGHEEKGIEAVSDEVPVATIGSCMALAAVVPTKAQARRMGEVLASGSPDFKPGDRVIGSTVDGHGAFAEQAMMLTRTTARTVAGILRMSSTS